MLLLKSLYFLFVYLTPLIETCFQRPYYNILFQTERHQLLQMQISIVHTYQSQHTARDVAKATTFLSH